MDRGPTVFFSVAETPLIGISVQTYVIYRCNRWGVYVHWLERVSGPYPGPRGVSSWWRLILEGNIEQIGPRAKDNCPVDIAEAVETGRCIQALPDHLRETMIEEHIIGGTQKEKAKALGIDVSVFYRRCQQCYGLLLGLMNDAAIGIPLEVEAQKTGRPPKLPDSTT